jgi:serpin B
MMRCFYCISGTLNAMSRLVLVNAVYFKAQWLQPFNSEDTEVGKFYISRNEEVDVPMMHMKTFFNFKHAGSLDAKVLELPYEVFMLCINESKF